MNRMFVRAVAASRCVALTLPLWPAVAWLIEARTGGPAHAEVLGTVAASLALLAGPAALCLHRLLCVAWLFLQGALSLAALSCLALTGELPTLGTTLVALHSNRAEALALVAGAWPAFAALGVVALAWMAGCVSLATRPCQLRLPAAARVALLLPLAGLLWLADPATAYPLSWVRIASGMGEFTSTFDVDRALVDNFHVTRRATAADELVVLVIGESSSAENWQLYGYSRETTPLLQRRKEAGEFIIFPAHMSTAAVTLFAVPALLSPFDEMSGAGAPRKRRSLVTLMARAGFRTAWLSTNDPMAATTEAQFTLNHMDGGLAGEAPRWDDWLVPQLGKWLDGHPTGLDFAVVHTFGSHLPFQSRYPFSFAKWKDYGGRGATYPANQTRDAYDNTILYTDRVMDALLERVAREKRPALVAITADHAETAYLGQPRPDAPRDAHVLHVPLVFWANAAWKSAHPGTWERMQAAAASGVVTSHRNFTPTLAGLLDIDYEGEPASRDVLGKDFSAWTCVPALDRDEKTVVCATPPARH